MQGILYKHHFLINERHEGKTKTFLACSQREPNANETVTVFVNELNDYLTIGQNNIIAILQTKPLLERCKICNRILEDEQHFCPSYDGQHLNPNTNELL